MTAVADHKLVNKGNIVQVEVKIAGQMLLANTVVQFFMLLLLG